MKEKAPRTKRQTNMVEGLSTILLMIILVGIGSGVFKMNFRILLTISFAYTLCIAVWRCGYTWKELEECIRERFMNVFFVFFTLLGIGFLIGTLMVSGCAPTLVMWLSGFVSPKYILVLSFVLCGILSALIGSNFTSCGSLGVVLFSIGVVQGVNPFLLAGAIIAGSNVGTYISPVSDAMNFHAGLSNITVIEFIKEMRIHTIITCIICTLLYLFLGFGIGDATPEALANLATFREEVQTVFNTNPIVVLPLVVMMVLSILKVNINITLYVSSFVGILIGYLFQGFSLKTCLEAGYSGFSAATMIPEGVEVGSTLATLVNRGGMMSLAGTVIIFMFAASNVAVMGRIGALENLKQLFAAIPAKTRPALVIKTALFCLLFTFASSDNGTTGLVAYDTYGDDFKARGYDPVKVTVINKAWAPIGTNSMPWCSNAAGQAGFYGLSSSLLYFPYSFIFIVEALVVVVLFCLGIDIEKKTMPAADAA